MLIMMMILSKFFLKTLHLIFANFFLLFFFSENDSDELADIEPEMDLEIQMAFKEFVKSAKNKQLQ